METTKPNILIVDDKKQNLLALTKILRDFDANIISATDGNEALQMILKHEFALVLMDVQMPVMDGLEAAKIMRMEIQTPIIFLTAVSTDREFILKGYEMGAVDYLVKPFEPKILKGKVEVFLCMYEQKHRIENYKNSLEQIVEERTAELKKTYEQLLHAEKLTAVGKLAASIAHEFNNPIFGILNVLEMIKEQMPAKSGLDDFVDLAVRECNRMADLIKQLRDFHRPSETKFTKANIHEIIDDIIMLFQKKFEERKIELEKDFCANMPELTIVQDQIKQVILNIIGNAEEAIVGNGGIIKITTEFMEAKAIINVHDSGEGIKKEDAEHIFEPFFTTKAVKGTGLGLSVSYNIIKQHGGDIRVDSKVGFGTKFIIELPAIEPNS